MAKLNSGTRIYGTATVDTTLAAGNTTITGFVNASASVNSAVLTVGTSFIANSSQVTISAIPLSANGATGTAGHVLHSNGATGSPYWAADDNSGGTVTSVASGNGLTGGPITTTGTLSISAQSGLLANSTGLYVNATSIALGTVPTAILGSGTANSTTFLAGDQTFKTISSGLAVTDDTTTNASRYVLFTDQTSGTMTSEFVSSTKMYFNPSTGKLNATSFNSLSDILSKENIKTLDNALSKILVMRGVSFTWKGTEDKSIGLIAQEVEHILPEVVSTSEDGIKSVSYDSIIGLLIEGIKEQQQTIEQMKSSINILLNKINTDGEEK